MVKTPQVLTMCDRRRTALGKAEADMSPGAEAGQEAANKTAGEVVRTATEAVVFDCMRAVVTAGTVPGTMPAEEGEGIAEKVEGAAAEGAD